MPKRYSTPVERFLNHIETAPNGCWLWTRSLNPKGYGVVSWHGKMKLAHRIAYELYVGPIPPGLQIDHLCRVRHCVNPAHLEPVTARENSHRGLTPQGMFYDRSTCPWGHPRTPENTRSQGRYTTCAICARANASRRHRLHKMSP